MVYRLTLERPVKGNVVIALQYPHPSRFGRIKAGERSEAPVRSPGVTGALAQIGIIPGLMGGSAYTGSCCCK
jgi:hypothetical protein